jgi:hypothetical protein
MFVPEGEWNHTGEKPATGSTYTKCGGILFPPHLVPEGKGAPGKTNDMFLETWFL